MNQDIRLHYYNDNIQKPVKGTDIRGAEEMRNYRSEGLLNIYNYAQENGYNEIWEPVRAVR